MKKRLYLILVVLFASFSGVMAQVKVSGTVTDPDGVSMPGVSVVQKGTTNGTTTDANGKYTLSVSSASATLQFSFVGMSSKTEVLNGRSVLNVRLAAESVGINEVVVTALGIQREKKTLTYASQQISGDEMMKTKDPNFMDALNGKTAGLDIKESASGIGGSTRVVLRGDKSISGLSSPLIVIDGVPMVNNSVGGGGMWGGTDGGDGLSQINPDDIESVSVLKGSNASVLYGSQGANGVILIVTKKGKAGNTQVTFNSTTTFENVSVLPKMQYEYGSGGSGMNSWSNTKGSYPSNYVKNFFQTGDNLINSLTVSGGNDRTTAYFSFSNTTAQGITPNNDYGKNNVTFRSTTKLNDKLSISTNVMLTTEQTNNRPAAGYYLNPLTGLYLFPRDQDFNSYKKDYQVFSSSRNMYLQNWFVNDDKQSNPYWIINNEPKIDMTKRAIASVSLDYNITKHLKFQARGNYDYAVKSYEERDLAGSDATNVGPNGRWVYSKYDDNLQYMDGIFTYNNKFGNFSLDAILGGSYQQTTYGKGVSVNNGTNILLYPNQFYFQNLPANVQVQSTLGSREIKEGLFANADLGYKDMLFLSLSGRNDWASTLAGTGNQSYFYPAIGLSAILSQMVTLPDYISFAKVRGSHTTVGNEVPYNNVNPQNTISSGGGISLNTQTPFQNLKPEMLASDEVGTEWRFLQGRAGFDFTYYSIVSTNQFINLPAPSGSGYTNYFINAGKITNKGVELTIDAEPVKTGDFDWKTNVNYSFNRNKVVSLAPQFSGLTIDLGSGEGYTNWVRQGGSFGDLYVIAFARNSAGQIILDPTTGRPTQTALPVKMGNLEPKFSIGWNNNFDYKDFSLNFLVDGKVGGQVFSHTEAMLDGYGVSQRTAAARDAGFVAINAIQGTTAVTKIDPNLYYSTIGGRNGIGEPYIYSRTNFRLAQLALTYKINVQKLKLPVKSVTFSLIGRNLFFFYKAAPFDPELVMSTGLGNQSLDNFNLPSTRTYGFNFKISF